MKQFKIFKHPAGEVQAVKQGWCWPAFFFSFIWAMVAKMWGLGVGILVAFLALGFAFRLFGATDGADALINVAIVVIKIIFGVNGNAWRETNLLSRGFELEDTVTAANKDGAVALFIKGASAVHASPPSAQPIQPANAGSSSGMPPQSPSALPPQPTLTSEEEMSQFGVTRDGERFRYQSYLYDKLEDALNYARKDRSRVYGYK